MSNMNDYTKIVLNGKYGLSNILNTNSNNNTTTLSELHFDNVNKHYRVYPQSVVETAMQNYNLSYYAIKDIEIIVPNKVIKVIFNDDTFEKAVCHDEDTFDLEVGISICILKKVFGSSQYHKLIRNIIKFYNDKCKKIKEDELKNKAIKAKIEKKRIKKLARKVKKEKEAREARIKEQAEAMLLAERLKKETSYGSIDNMED